MLSTKQAVPPTPAARKGGEYTNPKGIDMRDDKDDVLTAILNALCFALLWAASYAAILSVMGVEL